MIAQPRKQSASETRALFQSFNVPIVSTHELPHFLQLPFRVAVQINNVHLFCPRKRPRKLVHIVPAHTTTKYFSKLRSTINESNITSLWRCGRGCDTRIAAQTQLFHQSRSNTANHSLCPPLMKTYCFGSRAHAHGTDLGLHSTEHIVARSPDGQHVVIDQSHQTSPKCC